MIDQKLYNELILVSELELYDRSRDIIANIRCGKNQEIEFHTYRKVVSDRGLTGRDLLDARDARRIANKLAD